MKTAFSGILSFFTLSLDGAIQFSRKRFRCMSAPTLDQLFHQAKEALRAAQPALALTHLQQLPVRSLTPPQQAQADALRAHAYEYHSQWSEVARLLHPYEDRTRTAMLPVAVNHLLCLRLASLHTEQGELPRALHCARQSLELAKLAEDRSAQGEAHQMLGKAYRLLGQLVFARQHYQAALNLHQAVGARVLMAWSYLGLSVVATGSSEYALARQSLQRAFNLVTAADDPLLYGLLCSVQASTLMLEETAPLAERIHWFAEAKTAFANIGHRRFLARTHRQLGRSTLAGRARASGARVVARSIGLGAGSAGLALGGECVGIAGRMARAPRRV
jgi:tetratricopeptide (TPR) repeat protein